MKYILVAALTLNCVAVIFLTSLFSKYHSGTTGLHTFDISMVENTLRNQSPEEGRQNAITLLRKADRAVRSTDDLVHHGFYGFGSLLLANIVIGALCLGRLRGLRGDGDTSPSI